MPLPRFSLPLSSHIIAIKMTRRGSARCAPLPEEHEEVDDDDELMLTADDDGLSHADDGERSYDWR